MSAQNSAASTPTNTPTDTAVDTASYRPDKGDRGAFWFSIIVGGALTIVSAVLSAVRIVEVLGPGPTPVMVKMVDVTAAIPLSNGAVLPAAISTAEIQATELPLASIIAGVTGPILTTITLAAITVCLTLLALSIMRGRIFSKRNTKLVVAASLTGLLGFSFANLCDTMLANGALAWATGNEIDNTVVSVEPAVYLIGAFAAGVVITVFTAGERMQRDTEGLI